MSVTAVIDQIPIVWHERTMFSAEQETRKGHKKREQNKKINYLHWMIFNTNTVILLPSISRNVVEYIMEILSNDRVYSFLQYV